MRSLLTSLEAARAEKTTFTVGVFGHVDSGKSTLIGHLFVKLNIVSKEEVSRNKREAEMMGKQTFHFAWLLDQMTEERQRGVTIDTNERTIE